MRKNIIILALVIIVFITSLSIAYLLIYNHSLMERYSLQQSCNTDKGVNDYQLLSPDVAWLNANEFLIKQQHTTTSYADLKNTINIVLENAQGDYAFYFEDLTTGAWVGINEKEQFIPLSLFKVPIMIAVLKEVELGQISLEQKIILDQADIDTKSGTLWKKGAGYEISVKDLLIELIQGSDNTALMALTREVVSEEILSQSIIAAGFSESQMNINVTPKQYANMLRGLYFSNYLRRPLSELALTIMLDTRFNSQIPAGLPKDVKVAHKVGFYLDEGYYHDCGIIYAPDKPYMLCIMSRNSSANEANKIISQLSRIVYDSVVENNTTYYSP